MRGTDAASSALKEPGPEEEEVALEAESAGNQTLADLIADFVVDPDHNSEEEDEIRRRLLGPLGESDIE